MLVILGICAITDLKEKKIRNHWIGLGMICAIFFLVWRFNSQNMFDALFMMGVFFVLLFPLYLIRVLGAGDVKLLCMTAMFIGKEKIEVFLVGMLLAGGSIAMGKLLYYGKFRKRMRYFKAYVQSFLLTKSVEEYGIPKEKSEVMGMAVPIFIGAAGWSLWILI